MGSFLDAMALARQATTLNPFPGIRPGPIPGPSPDPRPVIQPGFVYIALLAIASAKDIGGIGARFD